MSTANPIPTEEQVRAWLIERAQRLTVFGKGDTSITLMCNRRVRSSEAEFHVFVHAVGEMGMGRTIAAAWEDLRSRTGPESRNSEAAAKRQLAKKLLEEAKALEP